MSNSCGDLPHALFRLFLYVCWFRPGKRLRECCACVRCRARVLAPHTILCPQVFRNFLEIVKYHWSLGACVTCGACSVRGGGRGWSPSSLGANHNQHERGRGRVVGSWSACVSANGRARGGGPHVCVRTVCRAVLRSARRVSRRTLWTVSLKKPGGRRKLPSKRESSKRKHATRCGSCPSVHSSPAVDNRALH